MNLKKIVASRFFKNTLLAVTLLSLSIIGGMHWWEGQRIVSTDDAYVNAHIVQIAPRITGKVIHLNITNNQYVKKNQSLMDLDPTPFELAANEAKAQLTKDQAQLTIAQLTAERTLKLVQKQVASTHEGDTVHANLLSARAALLLSHTNFQRVALNLQYTKLLSPTDGWVTNVSLREGNIVQANQPLFALISDQEFWIDANFKETEISKIHAGQKATIYVDMYSKKSFQGIVESISGGSGAAFSLLPPQNATGNWVKVTQRVPVRIRILNSEVHYPLRIGTSATVKIQVE